MTYEEFIDKASLKFNNKFTYHQETFVDHKTEMRITCPVHGDFKATPRAHLNSKYGCTECSKNSRILWTEDTVREESKKYKTKREFWKGSQKAYAIASKNKWLDSYTWITGGKISPGNISIPGPNVVVWVLITETKFCFFIASI